MRNLLFCNDRVLTGNWQEAVLSRFVRHRLRQKIVMEARPLVRDVRRGGFSMRLAAYLLWTLATKV